MTPRVTMTGLACDSNLIQLAALVPPGCSSSFAGNFLLSDTVGEELLVAPSFVVESLRQWPVCPRRPGRDLTHRLLLISVGKGTNTARSNAQTVLYGAYQKK